MTVEELIYKKAYKKGKFKLHSGEDSSYIFDIMELINRESFLKAFREFVSYEKYLVGIEFGGAILASVSGKPFGIVRKDGTIYGDIPDNYTLLDDVVTTEKSMKDAYKAMVMKYTHFKPMNQFMCVVDRRGIYRGSLHIESMLRHEE